MSRFDSILETRLKRKSQTCKVFEIKIDSSHLSQKSLKHISSLFNEAKWFYNYCLNQEKLDTADTTLKSVPVKVKDIFENRDFSVLKAHMKQGIKTRIFTNIKSLSSRKKKGYKVGRLKYRTRINSIPLPEFHKDFDIKDKNTMRLTGLKQKVKVIGLKQIPKYCEIANAHLIRKPSGFYFHITTFTTKEEKIVTETSIGIDFGCQTQLTLSDGTKIEFQVPVSKRLKRLDRRITRKQFNGKFREKSKKKYQDQIKRQREYEKLTNQKKDIRNKIVSVLTKSYKYVCFQDESIHAWHSGNHGKKIQNSSIGGIISDLKNKSVTPIEVNKFFPSTQMCPECGDKHKLSLNERVYVCNKCGYTNDRDVKSAICIEKEGMNNFFKEKNIPVDYRNFKTREILSSTVFVLLSKIDNVNISKMKSVN
jgi:putative transposase